MIASVARTLAEVKALPVAEQDMLLLRRLVHIYPQMQGTGGLHKAFILASYAAAHSNRLHDHIMPDSLRRTQTTDLRQT
jgi:hypothetical protein